jgi:hypothetical protein
MSDKPISFRLTPSLVERLRDFAQPEELDEAGECRVNLVAKRLLCEMLGESTEVSTNKGQVSTPSRVVDSSVDNADIAGLELRIEEKLTAQLNSAIERLREEFAGELHA